jgi:hypothetical protein
VFGVLATADTALGCNSAFESPAHRGRSGVWLSAKAVAAVARISLRQIHSLGATSESNLILQLFEQKSLPH